MTPKYKVRMAAFFTKTYLNTHFR